MNRFLITTVAAVSGFVSGAYLISIARAHPESECAPCVCPAEPPPCPPQAPLEAHESHVIEKALMAIEAVEVQAQEQVRVPAE